MSDKPSCRDCKFATKLDKAKKPMRPGTVYCSIHRKGVMNNYSCGQYVKR